MISFSDDVDSLAGAKGDIKFLKKAIRKAKQG
jgi:hypothetical protein